MPASVVDDRVALKQRYQIDQLGELTRSEPSTDSRLESIRFRPTGLGAATAQRRELHRELAPVLGLDMPPDELAPLERLQDLRHGAGRHAGCEGERGR
ncbi:MAG: hypothetical protein H8E78_08735 [Proteobacteria bacterium]|nr:hypothetical protein [Pseudomonadota bacterium]